ncbi:MAG: anthranilate phosphoribosyltransferase [Gammaproteobacteria bacterium]|nr:anthranilate phosphoribosyltransferase [Gammaproteobacteria bacterium]
MDLPTANRRLAAGEDLNRAEMQAVMRVIMQGEATPAQTGAFLTALAIKGETVEEITAAAATMREFAASVTVDADAIVDSVGTGGDGARLFNVSTAAALVAAAAGAVVAKHGNRAATGNAGSADVLEAAGVDITLNPQQVGDCIAQCGIGFMFAPTHHAATRHVIGARREIGIRTVFNLLGPLTNPAGATHQLVGVFDPKWVRPLAEVFAELGSVHTLVVCSEDGLDEISIAAPTWVAEWRSGGDGGGDGGGGDGGGDGNGDGVSGGDGSGDGSGGDGCGDGGGGSGDGVSGGDGDRGEIHEYRIEPAQFGIGRASLDDLVVADAAQSLALIREALGGVEGAAFDMVALNAGATLYAADRSDSIAAGVAQAREVLRSGNALAKLKQLAKASTALGAAGRT